MKLSNLFNDFFRSEKSAGILLVICTIISLVLTNSRFQDEYLSIWTATLGHHSVGHWINDGLMTIFFLLIGLELEREVYVGELADVKNSLLPIFAAVGGMLVPVIIHLSFTFGTGFQAGAGIPMATDIAFALAVLSLLGNRIPPALKVFLTALAVIDDLGAIVVISLFYSSAINWLNLGIAMGIFGTLVIFNRLKVHSLIPYLVAGAAMWYFMLSSGVHATITGVLLAFAIPFGDGTERSPSYILQKALHVPVAFFILPLFAFANTSVPLSAHWYQSLLSINGAAIAFGLLIGKPVGILSFCYFSVKLRLASLPKDVSVVQMIGTSFLGGIGFTMSIFITVLAFADSDIIDQSKIAIIVTSLVAAVIGYLMLRSSGRAMQQS